MKKKLLYILSAIILSSSFAIVKAGEYSDDLVSAIKLYKAGNYSECYQYLDKALKQDPANAIAYYYLGMTQVQLGRNDEAMVSYDKVISLSATGSNLKNYAAKGKRCIETPETCNEGLFNDIEDNFIRANKEVKFTDEVRGQYEKLKIENLMREMNRADDFDVQKLKQFQDYSGVNKSEVPTNDEIVAALRTLQNAGLSNMVNSNSYSDLSILTGSMNNNSMLDMFGNSSMNPMLIQALLSNNMTQGF